MKPLILIQAAIPSYRRKFIERLKHQLEDSIKIYTGDKYYDPSVVTDSDLKRDGHINNYYLLGRRFLWQTGFWSVIYKNNIIILGLNPRTLSTWLILIIRKILGVETVLWGHAWPRKGRLSDSDRIRHWMRLLADTIVVYTNSQKEELQKLMPDKDIRSAPNAVISSSQMSSDHDIEANNIIYVGRMVESKKPFDLYLAFKEALSFIPSTSKLIYVGDGPEVKKLLALIDNDQLQDRVKLVGEIYDQQQLSEYYRSSLVSASPGYIGLNITQSLGYGVPIMISKDEPHSPEIEAAIEGFTAYFYETNQIRELSNLITSLFQKRDKLKSDRDLITAFAKANYSIEAMSQTFMDLL